MSYIQDLLILVTDKDYSIRKNIAMTKGICISCGRKADHFTDASLKLEFEISGLCETCQNKYFGKKKPS